MSPRLDVEIKRSRWMRGARFALIAAFIGFAGRAAAQQSGQRLTLGGAPPRIRTEGQLRIFLDDLESQQFAINTARLIEAYYQWRGETTHRVAQTARLNNDLLNRRDYAAVVDAWDGKVKDSVLARRVALHRRAFKQSKADPGLVLAFSDLQVAIQDSIGRFRFLLDGARYTETQIAGLVDTTHDRARRRAAFLTAPQRAAVIGPMIRQAMYMNDSLGRQKGFATGADASLVFASLSRQEVIRDLDTFERATRPAYLAMLEQIRRDLNVDRVEPWDIGFWLYEQEKSVADAYDKSQGIARLHLLFTALGFKTDSLPIDLRIWDVPTGGIEFPIRPPFDARLLTNPFTGSDFYETLFHEYGHAVNTALTSPTLSPILLGGDEPPMAEGTAEALGHFAYDANWISRSAAISLERAKSLERIGKMQLLLWLRRSICLNAWVEVNAYGDLNADANAAYHDAYERFVGVTLPDGDYFGNRDMFATAPLYQQTYLYANMIAAQLRAAMRSTFGIDDLTRESRVAGWLTKVAYADGALVPWKTKVQRATGEPLKIDALAAYLTW
jgi:peptidyl-dipeptidase A